MAKVYKFELFVCDLDENMSIPEIEEVISRALLENKDFCCVCHFEDAEEGPLTDYDETMNLHQWEAAVDEWRQYFDGYSESDSEATED